MNCTAPNCPSEARADSNLCQQHILEAVKHISTHLHQDKRYGDKPVRKYTKRFRRHNWI